MKKILTVLLTFAMLLSLTACGGGSKENTPSSLDKTPGSVTQEEQSSETANPEASSSEVANQEEQSSEVNDQEGPSDGNQGAEAGGEETNVVVAPKTPDDPAPLVSRQVEGLTQEQVSEVYKYIYFVMGVPYEEMDWRIIDENILAYWEDIEGFTNEGLNPYELFDLYFVEKNDIEWPTADFIAEETKYSGTGNVVSIDNPHTYDKDGYECWRVFIDKASVDEVAAYIDALKANGFTFTPTFMISEERAAGSFDFIGQYEWQGTNEDGVYITFLHTKDQTTEFTGSDATQLIIRLFSQNPES